MVLALGIVLKLSPVVLVAYFLYRRAYRVVIATGVCIVVVLLLSMLLMNGYAPYLSWYYDMLPDLNAGGGTRDSSRNQGFMAFYMRLSNEGFLATATAALLTNLSRLAVVAVTFVVCCFHRLRPTDKSFDLEYGCVCCLTTLVSNFSSSYHFTQIMAVFMIVIVSLSRNTVIHLFCLGVLGISYALISFGAFGGESFSHGIMILFQSPKLYGNLLLWGLIVWQLYQMRFVKTANSSVLRR